MFEPNAGVNYNMVTISYKAIYFECIQDSLVTLYDGCFNVPRGNCFASSEDHYHLLPFFTIILVSIQGVVKAKMSTVCVANFPYTWCLGLKDPVHCPKAMLQKMTWQCARTFCQVIS